ncbi:MAG: CPBP family intramembrane metalloprotease [Candidatus Dormibacteraeota bacterium]|nr:CPBP family intramembrane metalloprotease [Candidatus Dormibacteraeota bacterium]
MALRAGAPSVPTGTLFAAVLLVPALLIPGFRARLRRLPSPTALVVGATLGAALLTPGGWLLATGHHPPTATLSPLLLAAWAPAVLLVAAAEEIALRAGIQPWLTSALGPAPAIVVTAAVFATLHYPLYGAVALPLDLGVGVLIGLLRQHTGSVAACWLAHAIADLGTWWLP